MANNLLISNALANALLAGGSLKELMENLAPASPPGSFISIYGGAPPATADTALNVTVGAAGVHTLLAKISADGGTDGSVGLLFEPTALNRAIVKKAGENWLAIVKFLGKDQAFAGSSSIPATFYRFHTAGDTVGEFGGSAVGAATGTVRIQGTVGQQGADLNLSNPDLTDTGTATVGIITYEVRIL